MSGIYPLDFPPTRRRSSPAPPDPRPTARGRRRRRSPAGERPRRSRVAARAHISTDFYTRLEQRRGARPPESTVAALALALRLDAMERRDARAGRAAP
ncbi:MAG: helix-turn-helix domain-containing protein, partial [Actinobacteria bacterium]|nr:helix-turn-helix domain-containing protein [Actinomycetota bacterium]